MAPEATETVDRTEERPVCPNCGHRNIPGAAFCARCGQSLGDNAPPSDVIDVEPADNQATSAFEPVTSTVTAPAASPWARPDPNHTDPGETTALPSPPAYTPVPELAPQPVVRRPRGARGFVLGVIAVLLILAVLAVYLYASWLGDSARSTVNAWLP